MRQMSQIERAEQLQRAHALYGGALFEIGQFRKQATALQAEGRVGIALNLIQVCSELFETYRRSSRLALTDADRQRLQAMADGVQTEKVEVQP